MNGISSVMFVIRHESSPYAALAALPPSTPVLVIDWTGSPWRIITAEEAIATGKWAMDFGRLQTAVVSSSDDLDFCAGWKTMLENKTAGYRLYPNGKWGYLNPTSEKNWEDVEENMDY